jgi:hypothetical protein
MKRQIILTIFFIYIISNHLNAQIEKRLEYSGLKKSKNTAITLNDLEVKKLITDTTQKLLLIVANVDITLLHNNWNCNDKAAIIDTSEKKMTFDVTAEIRNKIEDDTIKTLRIRNNESEFAIIVIKWEEINNKRNQEGTENASSEYREIILQSFKNNESFSKPYNYKKNKIDLFFNENGRLLNCLPVNVDQNDIFLLHIICKKDDNERYRVNIVEGLYAPADLSIRPFDKMIVTKSETTGNKGEPIKIEYEAITLQSGPFTSDNFTFQIAYDSINNETYNGPPYTIKINKLYHVGVGISMIRTGLENPDFRIAPLDSGTNTIESYDNGARTLLTFNVIWYWSILQQNPRGSVITNGRDVLKDEPTWSFGRLFPTIGVSFDNKCSENFFAGFVYEFARGGSLIAGVHYGKVKELSDRNFVLNKTPFTGTNDDIRINNVYKPAFFFGINIDTRIFNTLFGK